MKPQNAPEAANGPGTATAESTAGTDYRLANGLPLIEWDIAHLHRLDAVAQQAIAEATHRRDKINEYNTKRDAPKHQAVDEALEHVALFDQPIAKLVKTVRNYLKANNRYRQYGLDNVPCRAFVIGKIQAKAKESGITLL